MSSTNGFYYLFNDIPRYENLRTVKGKAQLIEIPLAKGNHHYYILSIKNHKVSCDLTGYKIFDKNILLEYVNQDLEAKVDKFNSAYECKFYNRITKQYDIRNRLTIVIFMGLYLLFLATPLIILFIYMYKKGILSKNKNCQ